MMLFNEFITQIKKFGNLNEKTTNQINREIKRVKERFDALYNQELDRYALSLEKRLTRRLELSAPKWTRKENREIKQKREIKELQKKKER